MFEREEVEWIWKRKCEEEEKEERRREGRIEEKGWGKEEEEEVDRYIFSSWCWANIWQAHNRSQLFLLS